MVKLISKDKEEFFISKKVAEMSPVIADQLENLREESIEIDLPFTSEILEIIVDFLHYKKKFLHHEKKKSDFLFDEEKAVDILKASLVLRL